MTTTSGIFCETIPCTEDEMQAITVSLFKGCNYNQEKIESYIENLEQLVEHIKTRYNGDNRTCIKCPHSRHMRVYGAFAG